MVRNNMVDNNTYNIMQAFVSTLEALEAYQKYSQDGNEQLWQQVSQHTEQVARILQQHLPQAMQQGMSSQGMSSQGATSSQSSMSGQGSMSNRSGMGSQGATASQNQSGMGQSGQSSTYDTGSSNYGASQRRQDR